MQQKRDEFLTKGGVNDTDKRNLKSRIFVTFNDPCFSIHVDEHSPMEQFWASRLREPQKDFRER